MSKKARGLKKDLVETGGGFLPLLRFVLVGRSIIPSITSSDSSAVGPAADGVANVLFRLRERPFSQRPFSIRLAFSRFCGNQYSSIVAQINGGRVQALSGLWRLVTDNERRAGFNDSYLDAA